MTAQSQQTPKVAPRKNRKLVDALRVVVDKVNLESSVAYPCSIVSFDATNQLAEVEVAFADVVQNDDGDRALAPMRVPNILVAFEGQSESGGGFLTFPVLPGQRGYVTVFDRSIDRWRLRGEAGDPTMRHTHQRIDGVYKSGLRDKSRTIPNFDQTAAVLEHTMIKLGASAAEAAVLGTTMKAWADSFVAWGTTHVHPFIGLPSGGTGSTSVPLNSAPTTTNFGNESATGMTLSSPISTRIAHG